MKSLSVKSERALSVQALRMGDEQAVKRAKTSVELSTASKDSLVTDHAPSPSPCAGCMDSVRRPPPPPRSYTETVQDDVNDATSSSFLEPPPTPAAAAAPLVGQDYAHSDLPPPTGPTPRRRRSTLDLRVPQGWRGDVGQQDDTRNDDRSIATGAGQPTDASVDSANASATDEWSPPPFLRMTSSTTLLVRDEADTSDDNDDDDSLGSEVGQRFECARSARG